MEPSSIDPLSYFAIRLWTSNIIYEEMNHDLSKGYNLEKWATYLYYFLEGLKHF